MWNEEEDKEEARRMSKIKEEIGQSSEGNEGKTEVCFMVKFSFEFTSNLNGALGLVCFMVFSANVNNISVISWRSVILVEETRVPGENHWPVASHWQTLSHNVVSSTPRHERGWNSQLWWWYALIVQIIVNLTTIRSRRSPLVHLFQWEARTFDRSIKYWKIDRCFDRHICVLNR